jgi:hypothetical protein
MVHQMRIEQLLGINHINIRCEFTPALQGTFSYSATFKNVGSDPVIVPSSSNLFTVYAKINFDKMNYFDFTQQKWIDYDPDYSPNIVFNPTGESLIKFDFLDLSKTSFGQNGLGFHPKFDLNEFTGTIRNPHDTVNIKTIPLTFSKATNLVINVSIPNSGLYFVRTSFPYVLTVNYQGRSYTFNLYSPISKGINNRQVCSHSMSPANTLLDSNDIYTIKVNQDTVLATIYLRTTDGYLYNYPVDKNKVFSFTFTPKDPLSNPNFDIIPTSVDGVYSLKVNSVKAGKFKVLIEVKYIVEQSTIPSKIFEYYVNVLPDSLVGLVEKANLSQFKDPANNILNDKTNDDDTIIHLILKDGYENVLDIYPNKSNNYLGLTMTLNINNKSYNVNWDHNTVTIVYDDNVYQVIDNYKIAGNYVLTISTKKGTSFNIYYKKLPGKISKYTSTVSFTSPININVGDTSEISLNLLDNYGENIMNGDKTSKEAALKLITVAADTVIFQSPTESGYLFVSKSNPITEAKNYYINVTYSGSRLSCTQNCIQSVRFQSIDFQQTVVNLIAGGVTTLSKKSAQRIVNKTNDLLLNFFFYTSSGKLLNKIDPSLVDHISCVITGQNYKGTPVGQIVNNAYIYFSFTPNTTEYNNYQAAVYGNYNLTCSYRKTLDATAETIVFPLNLVGDGEANDAGNGEIVLSNTVFSTTTLNNVAGVDGTLNLEFRTSENLRYNQFDPDFKTNFRFELAIPGSDLNSIKIEKGIKTGTYIITMNSKIARYPPYPEIITIRYKGNTIPTRINFYNLHGDLNSIKIKDTVLINSNSTQLKDGTTVSSYDIPIDPFDKYGNFFLQIFDSSIWSLNRIQRLLSLNHNSTSAIITSSVLTNPTERSIAYRIVCNVVGRISITSSFINQTYNLSILPGPVSSKSYANILTPSIIAGDVAQIKIFPLDLYSNMVPLSRISSDEKSRFKIIILQPSLSPIEATVLSQNTTDNSIIYQAKLTKTGQNLFSPSYSQSDLTCNNCQVSVNIGPIVFNNSQLYIQSGGNFILQSHTDPIPIREKTFPSFNLYLLDQYMNRYPSIPDNLSFEVRWSNAIKNYTLAITKVNDALVISIGKEIRYDFQFLIVGSYKLSFIKTLIDNKTQEKLDYTNTLVGDPPDPNASNDEMDVSQTYVSKTKITSVAGQIDVLFVEVRTKEGKRRNFSFEDPEKSIIVSFNKDNGNQEIYKTSVIPAEKFGQYYIRISSKKSYSTTDNNYITLKIDGKACEKIHISYIVSPGAPNIGYIVDKNNNRLPPSSKLPDANADNVYSLNMILLDSFNNLCHLTLDDLNYKIDYPAGKSCNGCAPWVTFNTDLSFTINIKPRASGIYNVSSSFMKNQTFTFYSSPGVPHAGNSIADVPKISKAGEPINVWVLPFDSYNNYIDPKNISIDNTFYSFVKWTENGLFSNYLQLPTPVISTLNYLNENVNAIKFTYSLTKRDKNFFRITLGSTTEISCKNCITTVSPAEPEFKNYLLQRYDSDLGVYVTITGDFSEKNEKSNPFYNFYPRDRFNNTIETVDDLSLYTASLTSDKVTVKLVLGNLNGENDMIKFRNDEDNIVLNPTLYRNLVSGLYTLNFFKKGVTEPLTFKVRLIGSGDNSDASNDDFDIKNVAIKEQSLNFVAGGSGYFIIEMRTTVNTRRNEWGYTITPVPNISSDSFEYKVNPAGKKGQYYVAIFTKKANTYPKLTPYTLDILISSPGKTEKVKSPLTLNLIIEPDVLTRAEIVQDFSKPSSINLQEGNADKNLVISVLGYDNYGNHAAPTESIIKLSVIDQSLSQVSYKSGIDVVLGIINFEVSSKTAGLYTITSPTFYDSAKNKVTYKYQNSPGAIYLPNNIISDITSEVIAGGKARIRITPRDFNKNYINDSNSIKLFSSSILTPTSKSVDMSSATIQIENTQGFNSVVISVPLSEKGINVWSLYYNKLPIECNNCQTIVKATDSVLANSVISITNNSGQYVVTPNGGSSSNNNAIPFSIQVKMRDTFNNVLDSVDSLLQDQISCVLSGNYMIPITFNKNRDTNRMVFSIDPKDIPLYNKLVSGNSYEISIVLATTKEKYNHKIIEEITSNWKDDEYGNGEYVVSKSILSMTRFDLNANVIQTFTLTLFTAQGKLYNNDIDLTNNKKDYEYEVIPTPDPGSFNFNIYKANTAPGVYNIDIKITKINAVDAQNTLKIKIRPSKNTESNKESLTDIIFTIKPEIPPDPRKTEINSLPTTINSGDRINIIFTLYDQFGNKYNKNTAILANLNILNNDKPVQNVNKQLLNDYQYSISFVAIYPPRQLSLKIMYSDSTGKNLMVHQNPLISYIISQPVWSNTVVSGLNMQRMKAGEKLDLNLYLKDINMQCVDTNDQIVMSANVEGPIEATSDENKVRLSFNFNLKKKDYNSTIDCNNYYAINIPSEGSNYFAVGTYRITVSISNQNIKIAEFNQYVSPDTLDTSKFVSTWTTKGDFNPGKVIAGTPLTFEIQAYDKYMNILNDPIPKILNCTISPAPGSNITLSQTDYKLVVAQNVNGRISGSISIFKTGTFNFNYIYDGITLPVINNSQGPFQISIYPTVCSEKFPVTDMTQLSKVEPGENTYFLINCYDLFNNKISKGGEKFDVSINVLVAQSLVSTSINSIITDNSNGSYKVEFIPVYPGSYSVGIVLKSNNNLYGNITSFEIKSSLCPAEMPVRCANDPTKCVKNSIDCIDKNPCATTPAKPISCLVNKQMTCVASQVFCDCPDKYIRCDYMNTCVPEDKDYLCSFNLELNCLKQFPGKPYFCPDGICRATVQDCPAQRVCPLGYNLCPDLSCQKDRANCSNYDDCTGNQIKCPDQTCVNNQKDCPSIITCSKPGQFVCPDGRCVSTDLECNPIPVCNAPNNILCPSNSCSNSITNCPKSVACGHGKSLCSDINCKDSCQ